MFSHFWKTTVIVGPAAHPRMLAILQDPTKKAFLKVELAVTVDAGKPFMQTTYNLEGDGRLALYCYEQIEAVFHSIQVQHFPNTDAVIRQLTTGQPAHMAWTWTWKTYAQGCV